MMDSTGVEPAASGFIRKHSCRKFQPSWSQITAQFSKGWLDLLLYQAENEKQNILVYISLYSAGKHFSVLHVKINLVLNGLHNAVHTLTFYFFKNV